MIRPLRQRHRRVVIALGLFLPVAFAVGLAARKPLPEVDSLPREIAPAIASFASEAWRRTDLFPKTPVQVRLLREQPGTEKCSLALSAARDFVMPDLLVYWVAGNSRITDSLPDGAILLDAFAAPQLPLPSAAMQSEGVLVLFSLADNEIVDVSRPLRFADSTN
jgi:hypothetical protein